MREWLKRRLGTPIALALGYPLRLTGRRVGVAIDYHRIADQAHDPSVTLVPTHDAGLFERQLRHLRRHYRLVPASRLPEAASTRRRGGRFPVAITFDDDLRSHLDLAVPALLRSDAPATFFLSGASLETPKPFWWELMQAGFDGGREAAIRELVERHTDEPPPSRPTIQVLAGMVERLAPDRQDAFAAELERMVGSSLEEAGLDAAGVGALAGAGFEIGFHTLEHRQLLGLDDAELARAMTAGRERLAERVQRPLDVIAYPHGKADERVALAARQAGYRLGYTTRWIAVTRDSDPLRLGRIEPPLASVGQLALRVVRTLAG